MFEITNVKSLLSEKNLTQEELAKKLGIAKPTLNAKINGARQWNYSELQLLRKTFDLTNEQFMSIFFK